MEQTLYLMRHGETLFDQLGKMEGWSDSPLTKKGIRQAKRASEYFKPLIFRLLIVQLLSVVVILCVKLPHCHICV